MPRKSVARCVFPEVHTPTHEYAGSPVYLNVYDLSTMNGYLYWAGVGIFHSGVEVHGVEYAFGAIEYPASGIFEVEPRQCPGYKFKKSIYIGTTFLNPFQVKELMKLKSENYYGHTYHLLTKNCNHFSQDVCSKLTGSSIPKWVNRLARLGSFCSCIIPEILEPIQVCHNEKDNDPDNEKVSLRMSNVSSLICPIVHHEQ